MRGWASVCVSVCERSHVAHRHHHQHQCLLLLSMTSCESSAAAWRFSSLLPAVRTSGACRLCVYVLFAFTVSDSRFISRLLLPVASSDREQKQGAAVRDRLRHYCWYKAVRCASARAAVKVCAPPSEMVIRAANSAHSQSLRRSGAHTHGKRSRRSKQKNAVEKLPWALTAVCLLQRR